VVNRGGTEHTFRADELAGAKQGAKNHLLRVVHCPLAHGRAQTIKCTNIKLSSEAQVEHQVARINQAATARRPLLEPTVWVLVNPAAGTKQAPNHLRRHVLPLLRSIGMPHSVTTLQRPRHCCQLALSADLSTVSAILLLGGDGIVSELITGLARRSDSAIALCTPLAISPSGTGNGIALSLAAECNGPSCPLSATLAAIKGATVSLDAVQYSQPSDADPGDLYDKKKSCCSNDSFRDTAEMPANTTTKSNGCSSSSHSNFLRIDAQRSLFGALSLSWGLVADVDIESDRLRSCGPIRFDVQGLYRLLRLRTYGCSLSFLPPQSTQWKCINLDHCVAVWAMNMRYASWAHMPAPGARSSDGLLHIVIVRKGSFCCGTCMTIGAIKGGKHVLRSNVETYRACAFELQSSASVETGPRGGGRFSLDGELVASSQAQPVSSNASVMCAPNGLPFSYAKPIRAEVMPSALRVCHLRQRSM